MPVQYKDYYKILGVPKDATPEAIRKAYRKLAREHHPDVNKDPKAEARFKEINEAHDVLSDPQKRSRYEQLGANWEQYERWQQQGPQGRGFEWVFTGPGGARFGNGGQFEGVSGFSDFFRTFFGDVGGFGATQAPTRRGGARAGADLETAAEITLVEAYRGAERTIEIASDDGARARRLTVKIPAGVRDGQRIRLAQQGGQGASNGPAGDLYVVVKVHEHPFFKRDGDDVRVELPVSLGEALLGGEVVVPTLRGRVTLRIPPETQNGRVIRLAGQGMPRLAGNGHGDMYVTVRVVLPQKLSDDEREAVRTIATKHSDDVRSHLL